MDILKIKNGENSKEIDQKEILTLIKLSRINNSVFINNKNISKNIKIGRVITIENFDDYKKGDFLEFIFFDIKFKIVCDENLDFKIPKTLKLYVIDDFMFESKNMIEILSDENKTINARCLKVNTHKMIIEVIGDDKNFLIENIEQKIKLKINKDEIFAIPRIKKVSKNNSLFSMEIINGSESVLLNDMVNKSRDLESLSVFKEIFYKFEEESKNA